MNDPTKINHVLNIHPDLWPHAITYFSHFQHLDEQYFISGPILESQACLACISEVHKLGYGWKGTFFNN